MNSEDTDRADLPDSDQQQSCGIAEHVVGDRLNAWLGQRDSLGGWHMYTSGFKWAAEILYEQVSEELFPQTDYLVYPIFSLYRHYLELRMKQVIVEISEQYGEDCSPPATHKLSEVWESAESWLVRYWDPPSEGTDGFEKDVKRIGELVQTVDDLDARAEVFRYPYDKKGNPTAPDVEWINLASLRQCVDEITELLLKRWSE